MTQKVILIALQKQIRKRDEIVILSQVSPTNRYIRTSMVFLQVTSACRNSASVLKNIFLGVCSCTKIRVKQFLEKLYLDKTQ